MLPVSSAMEQIFLAQRATLIRYLTRIGAGDSAEDVLHDLWILLPREGAEIRAPEAYLFRMATSILIDRQRSHAQRAKRDVVWTEVTEPAVLGRSEHPEPDRVLLARDEARQAYRVVADQGLRVERIFRRHRIDGLTQREVAAELGISIGTVEGDLRRAYAALVAFREQYDKE